MYDLFELTISNFSSNTNRFTRIFDAFCFTDGTHCPRSMKVLYALVSLPALVRAILKHVRIYLTFMFMTYNRVIIVPFTTLFMFFFRTGQPTTKLEKHRSYDVILVVNHMPSGQIEISLVMT